MPEGRRCKHFEGPLHDCAYVNAIDALIDEAMGFATRELHARGIYIKVDQLGRRHYMIQWDQAFHAWMDRLAYERGLRRTVRSVLDEEKRVKEGGNGGERSTDGEAKTLTTVH